MLYLEKEENWFRESLYATRRGTAVYVCEKFIDPSVCMHNTPCSLDKSFTYLVIEDSMSDVSWHKRTTGKNTTILALLFPHFTNTHRIWRWGKKLTNFSFRLFLVWEWNWKTPALTLLSERSVLHIAAKPPGRQTTTINAGKRRERWRALLQNIVFEHLLELRWPFLVYSKTGIAAEMRLMSLK